MAFPYLGIVIAPAVASVVSVMDVAIQKDRALYRRATLPVICYVAFDAGASLLLYPVLRAVAALMRENPLTAAAVIAGLVGPLLMRTKVPLPFQGNKAEKQFVNAVAMLRRLQLNMSAVIDDRCAAAETDWILDVVLPTLREMPLHEVEEWVIESISVKYRGLEAREARARYIAEVKAANKDSISTEERKHLMVQILIDACSRRHVAALTRRAKGYPLAIPGLPPDPGRGLL